MLTFALAALSLYLVIRWLSRSAVKADVTPLSHGAAEKLREAAERRNASREQAKREQDAVQAREKHDQKIIALRQSTINHSLLGAIFGITDSAGIAGYHLKPLGWVRSDLQERSKAEGDLARGAAAKYDGLIAPANVLVKLTSSERSERYEAGVGPKGNPYYKTRTVKTWEAQACHAIRLEQVDKPRARPDEKKVILDGSNIAMWPNGYGQAERGYIAPIWQVAKLLAEEGAMTCCIFDANIGYRIFQRPTSVDEMEELIGHGVSVTIVQAGQIADVALIDEALSLSGVIVSNDLFRDSIKARGVLKRRGFFVDGYAELLPARY